MYRISLLISILMLLSSCVYDYEPKDPRIGGLENTLVVIDGDIIVGGITKVRVSFSESLTTESLDDVPPGTAVWVESETGELYAGRQAEDASNRFEVNTEDLESDNRYRLVVSIPDRGEYISGYKEVMISPPIDEITWSFAPDNSYANIEVTTHSAQEGNLYCKWNYTENWESPSVFKSLAEYIPHRGREGLVHLTYEQRVERSSCWSEAVSTNICIANTEKLSQNVISKYILRKIPQTDTRAMGLYYVEVEQKALDKDAFIYWETLQRNIGGTGGIFSAQPVDLRGNIVSVTDPDEVVIGYINATTITKKSHFIDWSEYDFYKSDCRSFQFDGLWDEKYYNGYRVYAIDEGNPWWSLQRCVDCRSYSNSTKPDFWPR